MSYRVARYITENEIETQPGKYFWRVSAAKAAASLNAAQSDRNFIQKFLAGPQGTWQVFNKAVLDRAIQFAKEKKWQAEDTAKRKARADAYIASIRKLDDVTSGVPVTLPTKVINWLDEEPTDHDGMRYAEPEDTTGSHDEVRPKQDDTSWGVSEEQWDWANGGTLVKEITPEQAAGIACWPPLEDDLPTRTPDDTVLPADTLTPDEALDVLDQAVFTPRYAEPDALPCTSDAEHAAIMKANGDAVTTPGPAKSTTRKRPARPRTIIVDNDQDA